MFRGSGMTGLVPRPSNCDFLYRPPFRDPYHGREFASVAHDLQIDVNRRAAVGRDFYTDPELTEATQPDYEAALRCPAWERADLEAALEGTEPVVGAALREEHIRLYDSVVTDLAVAVRAAHEVVRHGDNKPRLAFDKLRGMYEDRGPGRARWVVVLEAVLLRTGKLYASGLQVAAEVDAVRGSATRFLAVRHLGGIPTDQTVPGVEAWDPSALPHERVFKGVNRW